MASYNVAYGKKENIPSAISNGTIPPGSIILTEDSDELFFYDTDKNLRTYQEKYKFDSMDEAKAWVAKYGCRQQIFSVHEGDACNLYLVDHNGNLVPVSSGEGSDISFDNPQFTGTLSIDGATIYRELNDEGGPEGSLILSLPWHGMAMPPIMIKLGEDKLILAYEDGTEYSFYHTGNLLDLTQLDNKLGDVDKNNFMDNTGLSEEVETKKIIVNGAACYLDDEGYFVIRRPMVNGIPSTDIKFGYDDATLGGYILYHDGNLKNLAAPDNILDNVEQDYFMRNTGLDEIIGDFETALDTAIALCDSYIGGES